MSDKKYRLITRSDMDGLVCAVLLKDLDIVDDFKFVHPKRYAQMGKLELPPIDFYQTILTFIGWRAVHLGIWTTILRRNLFRNCTRRKENSFYSFPFLGFLSWQG